MRILKNEEVEQFKKEITTLIVEQFKKDEIVVITEMFGILKNYLKSKDMSYTLIGEVSDMGNIK